MFIELLSLVIAFVSLLISVVALKIAQKTYIFSSKDYIPSIEYSINDEDEVTLKNKSKDLFNIDKVNFIKVNIFGFEDNKNKSIVEIPFVTKSVSYWWFDKAQKISIKKGDTGACAYICPYNQKLVEAVYQKINVDYGIESKNGYALPSLQTVSYFVEIEYSNQFQERKSIVYNKKHVHGFGFDNFRISNDEFNRTLNWVNIPPFETVNELWDYLIGNFSIKYDEYFGD